MSPLVPDQNKHMDHPAHSGTGTSFQATLLDAVGQAIFLVTSTAIPVTMNSKIGKKK